MNNLGSAKYAMDWSHDGTTLLYQDLQSDAFALRPAGNRKPVPVLHSEFNETQPQLSSDGKWLAFVSDESGRNEVYIQPFSIDGTPRAGKRTISNNGGTDPRWRRDGCTMGPGRAGRPIREIPLTRLVRQGLHRSYRPMTATARPISMWTRTIFASRLPRLRGRLQARSIESCS